MSNQSTSRNRQKNRKKNLLFLQINSLLLSLFSFWDSQNVHIVWLNGCPLNSLICSLSFIFSALQTYFKWPVFKSTDFFFLPVQVYYWSLQWISQFSSCMSQLQNLVILKIISFIIPCSYVVFLAYFSSVLLFSSLRLLFKSLK